ncbi:hypothetical protein P7K49_038365 [Saguinus oedipus]|uniref:Uncharacterized protein n=1 Tax=Saguinus oedipus TaxID=9490 RepID=A0ABQ9TEG5_SAGOE|nr:hypothetical protein P7K49_038365 [Saguinus oedipus]
MAILSQYLHHDFERNQQRVLEVRCSHPITHPLKCFPSSVCKCPMGFGKRASMSNNGVPIFLHLFLCQAFRCFSRSTQTLNQCLQMLSVEIWMLKLVTKTQMGALMFFQGNSSFLKQFHTFNFYVELLSLYCHQRNLTPD